MIIDAHTHIYPDKIAHRASESIGSFYGIKISEDGTVETLLKHGDEAEIDRFVVHSVATAPHQVSTINNFISDSVKAHPDRLIGFATLHPQCENFEQYISEALSMGLVGLKLHPDFQRFDIDCDEAMKIYETIEGKMPVLLHVGDYRTQYSKPWRILNVKKCFPKLDIIAAHLGGWSEWGSSAKQLAAEGVFVDTSSSLYELPPERARELIGIFGADHVFFGTDYPMWNARDELSRLGALGLSNDDYEKITHLSFERLLQKYTV